MIPHCQFTDINISGQCSKIHTNSCLFLKKKCAELQIQLFCVEDMSPEPSELITVFESKVPFSEVMDQGSKNNFWVQCIYRFRLPKYNLRWLKQASPFNWQTRVVIFHYLAWEVNGVKWGKILIDLFVFLLSRSSVCITNHHKSSQPTFLLVGYALKNSVHKTFLIALDYFSYHIYQNGIDNSIN